MSSVVMDSKSATKWADFSQSPWMFCGIRDGIGSSVCESIFTYQVVVFKRRCVAI